MKLLCDSKELGRALSWLEGVMPVTLSSIKLVNNFQKSLVIGEIALTDELKASRPPALAVFLRSPGIAQITSKRILYRL